MGREGRGEGREGEGRGEGRAGEKEKGEGKDGKEGEYGEKERVGSSMLQPQLYSCIGACDVTSGNIPGR